jgi:hypothetical protein
MKPSDRRIRDILATVKLLCAVVVLLGLAQPAFAQCEAGTPDCNSDNLNDPVPAGDPSLYADPAVAPSEDDGEELAPTHADDDTPDIDPDTVNLPPD